MEGFDKLATRTEAPITDEVIGRAVQAMRLLHGILGKLTELGEFADPVKKFIFYGKPLDTVNMIEELGDDEWYGAVLRDYLQVSQDTVQNTVIQKLRTRYPEKFTQLEAIVRDLDAERKVLEREVTTTTTPMPVSAQVPAGRCPFESCTKSSTFVAKCGYCGDCIHDSDGSVEVGDTVYCSERCSGLA